MFEIMIEDVSVIHGHTTVSGRCKNREYFTSILVDDNGTEYTAFLPFIKHVVTPGVDYITLELAEVPSPNALIGQILRGLTQ